jgi:hypothetical protein
MGSILASCCSDSTTGEVQISSEADDFVRFCQTIQLMPSDDQPITFDYGMTIEFAPSATYGKRGVRKQTRFDVAFDKRDFRTTLIHTKAGVWKFDPPLPGLARDDQEDHSIYVLLDNLKRKRWVHAPHRDQRSWKFTDVRRHVEQHGFRMNRQLYQKLFPKIPDEEEEEVVEVPNSMILPQMEDNGEYTEMTTTRTGTFAEMPAN